MDFYRRQVVPRLVDRACGTAGLQRWRDEVTAGLAGRVVEIGFGSGLNVAHYPPEVDLVLAVERPGLPGEGSDRTGRGKHHVPSPLV